ncbi:hypothetical protein AYI68_g491 [Smittium mucronatum]|uniref:Uncharacterized protein n=1 Tax=Smittium mucronatum TaxID=133383 RepID=A0A1R0H883_9FUNG|nr:hypothetical protein AYI68_g491 [Smittium mucronatum]
MKISYLLFNMLSFTNSEAISGIAKRSEFKPVLFASSLKTKCYGGQTFETQIVINSGWIVHSQTVEDYNKLLFSDTPHICRVEHEKNYKFIAAYCANQLYLWNGFKRGVIHYKISSNNDDLTIAAVSGHGFVPYAVSLNVMVKSIMIPIITGDEKNNEFSNYIIIEFTKQMSDFLGLGKVFYDYRKTIKDGKTGIYGLRYNDYWLKWDRACVIAIWGMQQLGEDYIHVLPKCFSLETPRPLYSKVIDLGFSEYQRRADETSCNFEQYRYNPVLFDAFADVKIKNTYEHGYMIADGNGPDTAILFKYLKNDTFLEQTARNRNMLNISSSEYRNNVTEKIIDYLKIKYLGRAGGIVENFLN